MAKILRKREKQKKIIVKDEKDVWQIETEGELTATEACDALLAAYFEIAADLVSNGMSVKVIRDITMMEFDKRLGKE